MMEEAVTLFPQPDSPTRAIVRPDRMSKETRSTTSVVPASVVKETETSRTSRSSCPSVPMRGPGHFILYVSTV